jgi:hypothetical protein
MPGERCAWKGYRCRELELTYLGKALCERHGLRLCELQERGRDAKARQLVGLRPRGSGRPVTSGRSR